MWIATNNEDKIKEYLRENISTIYHYHGTNPMCKVVDTDQKVIDLSRVYIGDISILSSPVPGSTSVSALVTGYRCSNKIYFEDLKKNDVLIEIDNTLDRLLKDNQIDIEYCVKMFNLNKNINLSEYFIYKDRLSKITACDILEHLSKDAIVKDKKALF